VVVADKSTVSVVLGLPVVMVNVAGAEPDGAEATMPVVP
jgi:hypothetical protein